jgi:hypothetical protein
MDILLLLMKFLLNHWSFLNYPPVEVANAAWKHRKVEVQGETLQVISAFKAKLRLNVGIQGCFQSKISSP